jgi:hypothetical protein
LQPAREPYFLITQDLGGQVPWPAFLVPISVEATAPADLTAYMDPADPTDEAKLKNYVDGDGQARVLLGTDTPVDSHEIIAYTSIEWQRAAPNILFVKDFGPGFDNMVQHFFLQQTQGVVNTDPTAQSSTPGGGGTSDPGSPPDPGAPPASPPVDPGNPPETGDPTPPQGPGGSVPPGIREPRDPDPEPGTPEPTDPVTPGVPEPTDPTTPGEPGDPTTPTDPSVPMDPDDPGIPAEPDDPEPPSGEDPEPAPSASEDPTVDDEIEDHQETDDAGGSGDPLGDGEEDVPPPEGEPPSEEEPEPDSSGGGSSERAVDEPPLPDGEFPVNEEDWESEDAPIDLDAQPDIGWVPLGPKRASDLYRFRGVNEYRRLDTWSRNHNNTSPGERNARYLPCFRVFEGSSGGVVSNVGRNDRITITNGLLEEPTRIAAVIRWGDPTSTWTALDDFIETRIFAKEENADVLELDYRGEPRILKFPCGELPDEMPQDMEFARSSVSDSDVVTAFLDELNIFRHPLAPLAIVVDQEGVEEDATEIQLAPQGPSTTLEGVAGHDADCGLVSIDGELIVYRGTRTEGTNTLVLEDCERGLFGTTATFHARGAYGRFVPNIPVSYLDGSVTRAAATIPMVHTRRWPRDGCVRILRDDTAELVHYIGRTEQDLLLPEALVDDQRLEGRGLLRGRFGTDILDHDSRAIVIWQPFRYWDRYMLRRDGTEDEVSFPGVYDHPEASFVEFGKRVRSGYFHRLTWMEDLDGARRGDENVVGGTGGSGDGTGFLDLVVLVRFSSVVPWNSNKIIDLRGVSGAIEGYGTTDQGRPRDHLYVLDDPEAANRLALEAETCEFRFFFVYRPGAFVPRDANSGRGSLDDLIFENAWKQTPWLRGVTLEYTSRTSTLDHWR